MSAVIAVEPSALLSPSEALRRASVDAGERAAERKDAATLLRQGFRIGNLRLMVPFDGGSELSEMLPVYRLPNCASWFKGLVNLHGNLVPVFDLAGLLGAGAGGGERPMLLVLGHRENAAAVLVDGLPQRLRFTGAERVGIPEIPQTLK